MHTAMLPGMSCWPEVFNTQSLEEKHTRKAEVSEHLTYEVCTQHLTCLSHATHQNQGT